MKSIIFRLFSGFALLACVLVIPVQAREGNLMRTEEQLTEEINEIIDTMDFDTKIGQLFIFGFSGSSINRSLRNILNTMRPGAIIVFSHNIKSASQIAHLNYEAQNISISKTKIPLLIAVDQEGGDVIRIKTSPPLPSALSIGKTKSPRIAERAGFFTGELLRTLGFNMNLAPVLDVANPEENSFIGTRSYSFEPEVVSKMGFAFAKGLLNAGILPTAKHFPGHGGINGDSHIERLQKSKTLDELLNFDLLPFKKLSKGLKSAPAIMVAHIAYPNVDPTRTPATYSPVLINQILRNQFGFKGMVVTDDIEMSGAGKYKTMGERAIRAIEAGNDLVMVVWSRSVQRAVVKAVKSAVRTGRIPMNRINESVRRILLFKKRYISFKKLQSPSIKKLKQVLSSKGLKGVSDMVTIFNLKSEIKEELVREVRNSDDDVIVFSASGRFYTGLRSQLLNKRKARFYRLQRNQGYDINKILLANPKSPIIYFVSGPRSANDLNKVKDFSAKRLIIVNTRTKGQIPKPNRYRAVLDVHTKHPELGMYTGLYLFKKPLAGSIRRPAANKEPKTK